MSLKTFICNLFGCCPAVTPVPTPVPVPVPSPGPTPTPIGAVTGVVIINQSSVSNEAVLQALPDFQTQVTRDFLPAWGRDATLRVGTAPQVGEWPIYLLDYADVPGALGYHDFVNGVPTAKVFTQTSSDGGVAWTTVLTHELLEMLADPLIYSLAYVDDGSGKKGVAYYLEVGDPVETTSYTVGGTLVSNFAYPAWFGEPTGPFDHLRLVKKTLQILPGGYITFAPVSGWKQNFADK